MDIVTVGGGAVKVSEGGGGLSGEGGQVARRAHPVAQGMAYPLGGDLHAQQHRGILQVIEFFKIFR